MVTDFCVILKVCSMKIFMETQFCIAKKCVDLSDERSLEGTEVRVISKK